MKILGMKKNLLVSLLCIFCAVSVFAQNKEEKKLIIETILKNDSRVEEFFKLGKADSIAEIFSPNSHLMAEFEKLIEKRESIEKHYAALFKSGVKYSEFKLEAEEHKVYDDLVLEIGENNVKYTKGSDSKVISGKYNYMLVWKKSKSGRYQIRAAMWNSIEDPCK
jgi:ketosteroid isomerase-like protein